MAWIYLAESEESQRLWKATSGPLPIVKTIDMQSASCYRECPAEICPSLLFGMTFGHCNQACCHPSTLSMEASPVRISVLQESRLAWKENGAVYLAKYADWQKKQKPNGSSSKMSRTFALKDLELSSKLWPKSAMTVGMECYPLPMWERTTKESDGSFWRTPDANCSRGPASRERMNWKLKKKMLISLNDQVRWPTPTQRDWKDGTAKSCRNVPENGLLGRAVHWRTPQARDWKGPQGRAYKGLALDLPGQVKKWPTPRANKVGGYSSVGLHPTLEEKVGGSLNPTWVEWLMGYPSEWTVLSVWAIAWFQPKREKHLKD